MAFCYDIAEKTARLFMLKEVIFSCENFPMDGDLHVDEFVLGGREVNKVVAIIVIPFRLYYNFQYIVYYGKSSKNRNKRIYRFS